MSDTNVVHHERQEPPHVGGDALAPGTVLMRIQKPALLAGLAGLALCAVGLLVSMKHPEQVFRAYLYSYMFWVGLPLGCLALLMLQHLTGGNWGLIIRRMLEAGSRMLPLMAVLFIPVLLGIGWLYVWDNPDLAHAEHPEEAAVHAEAAHDADADAATAVAPVIEKHDDDSIGQQELAAPAPDAPVHRSHFKEWWLQRGFFMIRAVCYFAIWIFFALLLNKWSSDEDRVDDDRIRRRMQLLSGPGILLYGITVTLAVFDWVMSLDPHWYSTLYGMLFIVGQALSALCACVLLITLLSGFYPFTEVLTRSLLNDLGNLMLTFVMLWAYLSFSQFLIIWTGNVAEETPYYIYRTSTGWKYLALFLILCHWFFPFCILLARFSKRSARILGTLAAIILVMRFIDLLWVIIPSFAQVQGHHMADKGGGSTGISFLNFWLYIAAPVGIGGVWLFFFITQLKRRPLLPPNDPRLEDLHAVAAHGGGH